MYGVQLSFPEFSETIATKPFFMVQKHWRRKQHVTNPNFTTFMKMPLFFEKFSKKELRDLTITGQATVIDYKLNYDNFNLSDFADKLNKLQSVIALKQTLPGFIYEKNYSYKWSERKYRNERNISRKVQWGRISGKYPQTRYFVEGNYIRRNGYLDICNSLLRYTRKLFMTHKNCIKFYQKDHHSPIYGDHNTTCFITKFYVIFSDAVNRMGTHFRLVSPQINDSAAMQHKRAIMNRLTGPHSRYTYDTYYHEFYDPINHLNEYIESSDVYAFHLYYEQFYKLFCQIMYEQNVTETLEISEPMTLLSRYKILFYPSFNLEACAQKVLAYCTSHNLCAHFK
ncbi:hypothetical protein [Lactiplantibacillus carotarum]|uniref:hypothetical protein n=1 Tax=Lactiplantibacillus carotarum TaxID=2993456 RepID=UPI00298F0954|nr:hypothetical protein [Lactiplantibacillus carotarum]